jgi:hypothetical protein
MLQQHVWFAASFQPEPKEMVIGCLRVRTVNNFLHRLMHLLRSREPGRLETHDSLVPAEPGWEGLVAQREPARPEGWSGQPIISNFHPESLVRLETGNQSPPKLGTITTCIYSMVQPKFLNHMVPHF